MSGLKFSSDTTRRLLSLTIGALALTLVTGLVYGRWTQRWGPTPNLEAAAARIASLPQEIGDWQLMEERPMSAAVVETLQCAGYANRVYVNRETRAVITVAMIVGPSGPTAVHTPEICYSSRAYEIAEPREKKFFGEGPGVVHSLWSMTLRSRNAGAKELQVYYGWSTGAEWIASQSPRFEFGGNPLLYKIQLAAEMEPAEDGSRIDDPCKSFIDALLKTYWQPAARTSA